MAFDEDGLKEIRDLLMRIDIRLELLDRKIADLENRLLDRERKDKYNPTRWPEPGDPRQWKLDKRYRDPRLSDYHDPKDKRTEGSP